MAYSLSSLAKATQSKKKRPASSLPPLGSYDPSIFLQLGANNRQAADAGDQFALGQAQAQDDYGIQLGRINQGHDLTVSDLGTGRDRSLADLATAASRAGEDHGNSLAALSRRYGILANQQGQADRRANVQSGGLLSQQAAIRSRNQAFDQAPIDLAYSRSTQDNARAVSRTGEDFNRGVSRADLEQGQRAGDLSLGLSRTYGSGKDGQPLGSATLGLIQTKNNALSGNLDLATVAHQQAAANGYVTPPNRKKKKRALIV